MENQVKHLEELGFSRYEARAYVALLRHSPQNGYELAKSSGVPRPNIYAVLHKLEARNAVLRLDTPYGVRYAPVPVSEFMERQEIHLRGILDDTRRALAEVASEQTNDYVWNAHGYQAMLEHAHAVLRQTQRQLLLAVWAPEAVELEPTIKELDARNIQILTLCLNGCPAQTCGACRGNIYRDAFVPTRPVRWLVAVSDNTELVVSEIGEDGQALTIRTRQPLFIDLARSNLRNSIALAALVGDLGKGLDAVLQPRTRETLGAIAPEGWSSDWLTGMFTGQAEQPEENA